MATIKSHTDLPQSKVLSGILPLESADMMWEQHYNNEPYVTIKPHTTIGKSIGCHCCNCWSLSALLGVLPPYLYEWERGIDFNLYPSVSQKGWWSAGYISQDLSPENKDKFTLITHADNPVDACYEMILKLHELKML